MAGEWINRDTGLRSHPAILHLWLHFEKKHHKGLLADCVTEMWAYADQFGHVEGDDIVCELTLEMLDVHVDVPGFAAGLVKYRENRTDKQPWIVVEGERLRFPKLYAVMDSSSKRRAENREKKKRERAARRKKGDTREDVPQLSRDKEATVPQVSRDTQRTAPPQQNTDNRTQITDNREQQDKGISLARGDSASVQPIPASYLPQLGITGDAIWSAWTSAGLPGVGRSGSLAAFRGAVALIAGREPHSSHTDKRRALSDAQEWLIGKVKAWGASAWVKEQRPGFDKQAKGWCEEARYDDDEREWNKSTGTAGKPTAAQRADAGKFRHQPGADVAGTSQAATQRAASDVDWGG